MSTLTVTGDHDFRGEVLPPDITDIVFNTSYAAHATFAASQFGGHPISDAVHITGDLETNEIKVYLSGSFSAAAWTFTTWDSDFVQLNGSSNADTIIGSSQSDRITGGGGADVLSGGGGNDYFQYQAPAELAAGESIDGGAGSDAVYPLGSGSYDFSGATLTSIENLLFGMNPQTVTLAGDQIGAAGSISNVYSGGLSSHSLIVNAVSNVNLSGVSFYNWTAGTDTVTINGTAGPTR